MPILQWHPANSLALLERMPHEGFADPLFLVSSKSPERSESEYLWGFSGSILDPALVYIMLPTILPFISATKFQLRTKRDLAQPVYKQMLVAEAPDSSPEVSRVNSQQRGKSSGTFKPQSEYSCLSLLSPGIQHDSKILIIQYV